LTIEKFKFFAGKLLESLVGAEFSSEKTAGAGALLTVVIFLFLG
jgi:hypothetical protein